VGSRHRIGGTPDPQLVAEVVSVVGVEKTEGEATAWNNADKLAVDSRGHINVVYQYEYNADGPDLIRYARSEDGHEWQIEEWPGRYSTVTADSQDRVYAAYVERTPKGDQLWLRRRDPQGEWNTRRLFQAAPHSIFYPALAAGPEALHLAWEAHTAEGHSIHYATFSLRDDFATAAFEIEQVATNPQGIYFATLALDSRGRVHLAWEAARDPVNHQIDAAVRIGSAWKLHPNISNGVGNARYPALGLGPDGRLQVVFVVHEEGLRSSLHTAAYDPERAQWGPPKLLVRRQPQGDTPIYAQRILAFPVIKGEYAIWGNSVPAACGAGPLFWARAGGSWSDPYLLLGEFASYPHVIERPQGVLHLVWTDRDTQQLRAFVVRYARLRLP